MPLTERISSRINRRDFLKLAGGTLASLFVGVPLAKKFATEAQALPIRDLTDPEGDSKNLTSAPKPAETPPPTSFPDQSLKTELKDVKTGKKLLENLGLSGKVIYLVYGRPAGGWGTLGESTTAEQAWNLADRRKKTVSQGIGKAEDQLAYTIINPVYYFDNRSQGAIKDIYVDKALELAPRNDGLVAFDFSDIGNAKKVISEFDGKLSAERLAYLSVSLDVEHFLPSGSLEASEINEFSQWFAEKHQKWMAAANVCVPGFVFIYTHGQGRILNMEKLRQYYLPEGTLVVPIFDGYGSDGQKLTPMAQYISTLPNTEDNPALLGVMEFQTKWGGLYDTVPLGSTFRTLEGAPVFFFASQ